MKRLMALVGAVSLVMASSVAFQMVAQARLTEECPEECPSGEPECAVVIDEAEDIWCMVCYDGKGNVIEFSCLCDDGWETDANGDGEIDSCLAE